MRTIHKTELRITEYQTYAVRGSNPKMLAVQLQRGSPCIWYEVDIEEARLAIRDDTPDTSRITVAMVGTDHENISHIAQMAYMGTIQLQGGELVLHVYVRAHG